MYLPVRAAEIELFHVKHHPLSQVGSNYPDVHLLILSSYISFRNMLCYLVLVLESTEIVETG